jgi:hypothetical protein
MVARGVMETIDLAYPGIQYTADRWSKNQYRFMIDVDFANATSVSPSRSSASAMVDQCTEVRVSKDYGARQNLMRSKAQALAALIDQKVPHRGFIFVITATPLTKP